MDLFVTRAATIAHDVEAAGSSRAFRSAVQDFERLLSRIARYPSDFLTDGDAHALASLADIVVNRIEDRLDAHADRSKVQLELARRIYQVRRDLETIFAVVRTADEGAALRA
ncbi:MAG TPA: hypothetical protein VFK57_24960 [Vicinamibacterales bacterium]|nr:hypothetical protein [Vicinamibacterales bacterium]